jgi:hypothetical protein
VIKIINMSLVAVFLGTSGLAFVAASSAEAETVVRDHRKKPIVRDHRKPNFCFGALTGTNCYRF